MSKDIKNALQLYRDCLRLADYVSLKQGNRAALRQELRRSFEQHRGLTDPQAIDNAKDAAVRGLRNFFVHEAQNLAKKETEGKPNPDINILE
mmetsp:Transcript_33803/g.46812  ORF Transcript_33803/g.46812 Transcript_33803/m.46812 type:complete len:92 (-) Transcript_33803:134-409(-)|eukprot:CAMPEP_0196587802 /NCGR_PEP_ID=MMETSP1081-20130531/58630_1 /TAXON_ID=36882 /ORGANISM="Pyramimonas amylifera, Strain CCMP720" /LENGTH=91 /DNA_ID=CAMNT_0041910087 /DNA_START=124 /DNA_END=399 /DNA_ORIENTATION=+